MARASRPARRAARPARAAGRAAKTPARTEFDRAWAAYNAALGGWKEALAAWQRATNETLVAYNEACQKALESDSELLKKVSSSWESTWEEIGPEYVKQQTRMIEGIFRKTNVESMRKFNEQWERFLRTSGGDSIRAYQEAIRRFNQAWRSGTA